VVEVLAVKKFTFAMPSPDEFLVFIVMTDTLGFSLIIVLGNRL